MTSLVWDEVGTRGYEAGLDRGVLYLMDGTTVPWNGLTSVDEKVDSSVNTVYFDGMKISALVTPGDFQGTIKAITYPTEFLEVEGMAEAAPGMYFGEHMPKLFNIAYRTRKGSDTNEDLGYKLHILYNLIAIPAYKSYATISDDPSAIEFEWEIQAIYEEVEGYRPTARVIIDSNEVDPEILTYIEEHLYGTEASDPEWISLANMLLLANQQYRYKVMDNGDGTYTVFYPDDAFVTFDGDEFTLTDADSEVIDSETYVLEDTYQAGYGP